MNFIHHHSIGMDLDEEAWNAERQRDALNAAIEKYFKVFESSKDDTHDAAILEGVRVSRAELRRVEQEIDPSRRSRASRPAP